MIHKQAVHERDAHWQDVEKASDVGRQLAFAGLGLIWLMALEIKHPGGLTQRVGQVPTGLDKEQMLPAVFFCSSILFDFLRYLGLAWLPRFRETAAGWLL